MAPSHSELRSTALLDAVIGELADHGYAPLTIDRVAARAHASKATIYRRWPTKVDLVIAVTEVAQHELFASVGRDGELRALLLQVIHEVRAVTSGDSGRLLIALHEASRAEPRIRDAVDGELVLPMRTSLATWIGALQQAGIARAEVDAGGAARLIVSVVLDRALALGAPIDDAEIDLLLDEWLVPVLAPQTSPGKPCRPSAGPG